MATAKEEQRSRAFTDAVASMMILILVLFGMMVIWALVRIFYDEYRDDQAEEEDEAESAEGVVHSAEQGDRRRGGGDEGGVQGLTIPVARRDEGRAREADGSEA